MSPQTSNKKLSKRTFSIPRSVSIIRLNRLYHRSNTSQKHLLVIRRTLRYDIRKFTALINNIWLGSIVNKVIYSNSQNLRYFYQFLQTWLFGPSFNIADIRRRRVYLIGKLFLRYISFTSKNPYSFSNRLIIYLHDVTDIENRATLSRVGYCPDWGSTPKKDCIALLN